MLLKKKKKLSDYTRHSYNLEPLLYRSDGTWVQVYEVSTENTEAFLLAVGKLERVTGGGGR